MRVEPHVNGAFAILDDQDRIVLSRERYEDLYYILPMDHGSLFLFMNGTLFQDSADRAALERMADRLGGVEAGMTALQESARQIAPDTVLEEEERAPAPPSLPPAPGPLPTAAKPIAAARASGAVPLPAGTGSPVPAPGAETRGICLIEHDDWTVKRFQEAIKGSRFQVIHVERNIEPGLEWIARNKPPMAVLDLGVPQALETTLGGGLSPVRSLFEQHPHCRLVVTYKLNLKPLLAAAMRAGAHASLVQPFQKSDVLYALNTAATEARSGKYVSPAAIAKCRLAGTWKSRESGLLGPRQAFLATTLDLRGVEGTLETKLKPGALGEVSLPLVHGAKPLVAEAEVASYQWDPAQKTGKVRFGFRDLPIEEVDRIAAFIRATKPKAPRRTPPPLPV